jgi:hypothetical protein
LVRHISGLNDFFPSFSSEKTKIGIGELHGVSKITFYQRSFRRLLLLEHQLTFQLNKGKFLLLNVTLFCFNLDDSVTSTKQAQ